MTHPAFRAGRWVRNLSPATKVSTADLGVTSTVPGLACLAQMTCGYITKRPNPRPDIGMPTDRFQCVRPIRSSGLIVGGGTADPVARMLRTLSVTPCA